MTDYTCPACNGGFPASDACRECPWCGQEFGDYDFTEPREVRTVATNHTRDNGGDGLAARLGFR